MIYDHFHIIPFMLLLLSGSEILPGIVSCPLLIKALGSWATVPHWMDFLAVVLDLEIERWFDYNNKIMYLGKYRIFFSWWCQKLIVTVKYKIGQLQAVLSVRRKIFTEISSHNIKATTLLNEKINTYKKKYYHSLFNCFSLNKFFICFK